MAINKDCIVFPLYPQGIGSRTAVDTKIPGCSSPLYKMASYSRPFLSVIYGWESADAEPVDTEDPPTVCLFSDEFSYVFLVMNLVKWHSVAI